MSPAVCAGRKWVIDLTGPRYSANDRLHWRKANALKKEWREQGQLLARHAIATRRASGQSHQAPGRVHVLVEQIPSSRRKTDPGNVAPAAKAAIDGLVLAGLLLDDDAEHLIGPDYRLGLPQKLPPGHWLLRFTISEVTR